MAQVKFSMSSDRSDVIWQYTMQGAQWLRSENHDYLHQWDMSIHHVLGLL